MNVPLSWLKDYVDVTIPATELAHRLTMAGVEVGGVQIVGGWENCYVGEVLRVEPHPNADRLRMCTVNIGREELRVVCGAPNVAAGLKVPFATVGARLFNTHSGKHEALKASRIRGELSEGMICSELELGLGQDHSGIIELPQDAPLGQDLTEYLGDQVLEVEVTPNRLDCLSVLGIAREVASLTGRSVREPDLHYPEEGEPIAQLTSVEIAHPDLCYRYTASLITGLKIGPSPQWLQQRLTRAGLRPISNVVDVTNYVMLEYNQPLHAFDFHKLQESRIVVRRAAPGETLVSLDGADRKLDDSMLVIADARVPVGLAGVMGGANTEISDDTTAVILESATFDARCNRRTSQKLGLRTEASLRFEKGLRPELAPLGLRRATQLFLQVAGGKAAQGIIDVFPGSDAGIPEVTLTPTRLKRVLGIGFEPERVERCLSSLGFTCQPAEEGALRVTVPYWRSDIAIEEDLIEEVARTIGYDEIPTTMISTPVPHHRPEELRQMREEAKDALVTSGFQEIINYPVASLESLQQAANQPSIDEPLRLFNPLNARAPYLRTSLRSGVLSSLAANRGHDTGPLALFEAGRAYIPREGDLPREPEMVVGVMSGPWRESWWQEGDASQVSFYDAKGVVDALLQRLRVAAEYEPSTDPVFAPGRGASIVGNSGVGNSSPIGIVGELHPSVAEAFDLGLEPTMLFELELEPLLRLREQDSKHFASPSRFPPAVRDLAVNVDRAVPAAKVLSIITRHRLVARATLFDVYRGTNVPAGKRSLAYRIEFQSREQTLTAEQANRALRDVLGSLERELGATLRGQLG